MIIPDILSGAKVIAFIVTIDDIMLLICYKIIKEADLKDQPPGKQPHYVGH
jgi:hypothetical protein